MTTKKLIILTTTILALILSIVAYFFIKTNYSVQNKNNDTNLNQLIKGRCGDGVCDEIELRNLNLCPEDCEANTVGDQTQQGKCGDGNCGEIEKANTNLCPEDCEASQGNTQIEQNTFSNSSFSPSFGVHPSSFNKYEYAKDLGIDFNREGTYFVWSWIDIDKTGLFKFKNATAPTHPDIPNSGGTINYDNERRKLASVPSIETMTNVCPFRKGGGFKNTEEENIYQKFIEKLAERYDGDSDLGCTFAFPDCYNKGDNEYPDELFIATLQTNPIKYWQTCNQVMDTCLGSDCKNNNYAIKYAKVQELTYLGVKASCPECQVLIAGDSGKTEYPPVYEALNGKYIDIIDKHFFGEAKDYAKIKVEMDYLKNSLKNSGFDLNKLKFWITETGTYSGAPIDDRNVPENLKKPLPYQSESQQAEGLIKRYAMAFGEGIEKVLWAWGVEEGFGCDCCIFDYTGLIYDGNRESQTCDANDPYDLGKGVKKLAYYSFKLMVDKIGDFSNIEVIQDSENYVYKFTKDNKPIYIAWSDNGGSITLLDINSKSVKIIEAVPKYETGKEVTAFDNAFNRGVETVSGSKITLSLGEIPVFIE